MNHPSTPGQFGTNNIETKTPSQIVSPGPLTMSALKPGELQKTTLESKFTILQSRTLEEIVARWARELDSHLKLFHKQAIEISRWDKMLIEQGEELAKLYDQVCRAEGMQKELDQNLDYLEAQQQELERLCSNLETQVQKSVVDISPQVYSSDMTRERMYTMAESVGRTLENANASLNEVIEELNSLIEVAYLDMKPQLDIIKILTSHLDAIQSADRETKRLEQELMNLQ